MNTAKRLKDLNLQPLPKRSFLSWIKEYGPAIILTSLLGTYVNLYLVENNIYTFSIRPISGMFSINIAVTLVVLPILGWLYLYMMKQLNQWGKIGITFFISLAMPVFERFVELFGLLNHANEWEHIYTFFGCLAFLIVIHYVYSWTNKK